jgi:hypothetical protein
MKAQVEKMLDNGIIEMSSFPWSAPTILVPKKSPNESRNLVWVDFRFLHAIPKFERYPLTVFEETTSTPYGSKYFSVIGCYSGFCHVIIKEEHKEWTGLRVPFGYYDFNRLPFVLSNIPANFQRNVCGFS